MDGNAGHGREASLVKAYGGHNTPHVRTFFPDPVTALIVDIFFLVPANSRLAVSSVVEGGRLNIRLYDRTPIDLYKMQDALWSTTISWSSGAFWCLPAIIS